MSTDKVTNSDFVITAEADIISVKERSTEQKEKALAFIILWVKKDNSLKRRKMRAGITEETLKLKTGYASQASLNNLLCSIKAHQDQNGAIVMAENSRLVLGTFTAKKTIYLKVRKPREGKAATA